jgi:catalase
MPLPNDEKLIALSEEILKQLEAMFGSHPGFRPVHAKGILLAGTFTPSSAAASLTRAQHAVQASTPVTVRFSDSTGVPLIPDNDPNADPRGMAIRFNLAEHVHTDIVAHSANGFPATTGQEFLEFLRGVTQSDPAKVQAFVGSHCPGLRSMNRFRHSRKRRRARNHIIWTYEGKQKACRTRQAEYDDLPR